jgi:uncharacterized hydrophobic protein (TIGR00341 family)
VRLLQITLPSGKRETLLRALDNEEIDYVVSDETSGREFEGIAYVPLPTNAVEPILETLRDAGLDEDSYTIVLEANTVVSERFEELEGRYAEEEDEDRIARDELVSAAADLAPSRSTYVLMTVVSAVVATAGLLLDSPAVVVGSMVIAPLVGPALSASVGTVVDDTEMFRRGVLLQVFGLLIAVLASFVFAFAVRYIHLVPPIEDVTTVPEVRERIAPDFLSLAIAIGAGIAGIVSLTSGVSAALVGVMIAVALIPPAATVGIGLAWGQPMVSLGAGVLVLVNVLSINLSALVVLWYKGYRPQRWFQHENARRALLQRGTALLVSILVLSAFLGGVTLDTYQRASAEETIDDEATAVIGEFETTQDLELLDIEAEYQSALPFQSPERVVVRVGIPPGESVSGLAVVLRDRLNDEFDASIDVRVQYVQTERS